MHFSATLSLHPFALSLSKRRGERVEPQTLSFDIPSASSGQDSGRTACREAATE